MLSSTQLRELSRTSSLQVATKCFFKSLTVLPRSLDPSIDRLIDPRVKVHSLLLQFVYLWQPHTPRYATSSSSHSIPPSGRFVNTVSIEFDGSNLHFNLHTVFHFTFLLHTVLHTVLWPTIAGWAGLGWAGCIEARGGEGNVEGARQLRLLGEHPELVASNERPVRGKRQGPSGVVL